MGYRIGSNRFCSLTGLKSINAVYPVISKVLVADPPGAIESFTAIPFTERARPERPTFRPAYQGSNPISHIWSLEALRLCAAYIRRAAADCSDDEARAAMLLASSYAGIGFGNAGVHLPHGMSYPIAGLIRDWRAPPPG